MPNVHSLSSSSSSSARAPPKDTVCLNVYDLHDANNKLYHVGLGIYHSGVELNGVEYAYGGHDLPGTGVFRMSPRQVPNATLRESIVLGTTSASPQDIGRMLKVLGDGDGEFQGRNYHILYRNCNHFSAAFVKLLLGDQGVNKIPSYINRMAWLGSSVSCVLPQWLAVDTPTQRSIANSSPVSDSSAVPLPASVPPPGSGAAPTSSSRFPGQGRSLQ